MKELTWGEQKSQLHLDVAYIWVQVHDIPFNMCSTTHKQKIGTLLRSLLKLMRKTMVSTLGLEWESILISHY